MARKDGIQVEGRVVEALPNTLFRVELANGHRFLAHLSAGRRRTGEAIAVGDKVTVRMSPYDLSKGCITQQEE